MGYERYPRNASPQGDYYGRTDPQDYGQDFGSGRYGSYSSARDYQAAGEIGGRDRNHGAREYGHGGYADRDRFASGQQRGGYYPGDGDPRRERGYGQRFGSGDSGDRDYGRSETYDRGRRAGRGQDYGGQPQGYDYEDRGFFARAGDEVRSWFGDDEAERRRAWDARNDDRGYGGDRDYHNWRRSQIDALDRDYDEYRRENQARFDTEFGSWRSERQTQRGSLGKVTEHMDVAGSDGAHVGTVDKVRGDRILLTKSDQDAGGRHHSIPSRWIAKVDDKVTLTRTAEEAHAHWRDEERNQAFFKDDDAKDEGERGGRMLNRSFSGTY